MGVQEDFCILQETTARRIRKLVCELAECDDAAVTSPLSALKFCCTCDLLDPPLCTGLKRQEALCGANEEGNSFKDEM